MAPIRPPTPVPTTPAKKVVSNKVAIIPVKTPPALSYDYKNHNTSPGEIQWMLTKKEEIREKGK
jgi:hypothetical protein